MFYLIKDFSIPDNLFYIMYAIPVYIGVFQFKYFIDELRDYKNIAIRFETKLDSINQHFSKIANKEFDEYPFFIDINHLVEKTNKILK
jgi:hypothetical protein